jgi:hypothetical protein
VANQSSRMELHFDLSARYLLANQSFTIQPLTSLLRPRASSLLLSPRLHVYDHRKLARRAGLPPPELVALKRLPTALTTTDFGCPGHRFLLIFLYCISPALCCMLYFVNLSPCTSNPLRN